MSQESGAPQRVEIAPLRLPRDGERVIAERRRALTHGGRFLEWVLETLLVRPRTADERNTHDVLAAVDDPGERVWVLEQLYAHRIDPSAVTARVGLTDQCDVDPDEWERHDLAPDSDLERDPLAWALEEVSDQQLHLQRVEAKRVAAALTAWRRALADEGEATASNTPFQRGFLADLGFRLKIAASTARTMVTTAATLEQSLPKVWAYFQHGRTTWRVMQTVASALDGLHPAHHADFDAGALRKIIDVAPVGLPDALRRLRERLQVSTADERHDRAAADRHVTVEPAADGMAWLHAYLPAADALSLDHQLSRTAIAQKQVAGETRGIRQLKADALVEGLRHALRKPRRAARRLTAGRGGVVPQVLITIPAMTVLGHSTASPTLEGYGPIGVRTALRLAGHAKSWVRVLSDPLTGSPLTLGRTRYRPTKDMRLLLRLLDGGSRGPCAPRPPGDTEVDHTVSFHLDDAGGDTAVANLALLTHREHKDKTEHALDYDLLLDRTALWRTPTGNVLVTRPLDPPEATPIPPELIDPDDCPFWPPPTAGVEHDVVAPARIVGCDTRPAT